jgi:diguanylate cyclase (GGDEF)-like protein
MADAKNGQIRRRLKDWLQHVRRLRPAQSVVWVPAVAIALIAAIWVAAIIRIEVEGREARETAAAASAELASSFSAHIAKTVHDADVVVRWVKYEYERSPATFNVVAFERQGLIAADTALQVTIVGANGEVLQTTTPPARPVNLADRPHFIIHKINPDVGLYISQPVLGRVSHHWTLQFTRRLNNPDGSFAGVVVVSEDPNYLTNGFYNHLLGPDGMLAVISDNGYLLSRRTSLGNASPVGPPAAAYREMMGEKGGVFTDPVDYVRRFVTYRHLPQYPVAVLVGLSERDALADYQHAKVLYLVMAAVISALLLMAAALIALMMGKLQGLAETDSLTGLPNRHLLTQMLHRRMSAVGASARLAMLYIDLDNFKKINDTLGHKTGDELLLKVAYRLTDVAERKQLLARIGGDEFVILLEDDDATGKAVDLADAIIRSFDRPFVMRGNNYPICVSIGIAIYKEAEDSEFDLLTQADLAMYAAKETGKPANVSQYCTYTPALSERALHDIERYQELQYAIINREFFLEYQPIVSLDGELRGVEALVRWRHPARGVLLPAAFIPFAESSGFVVQIGEFVLDQACQDFREWQEADPRPLTLSINVSPIQLTTGNVVRTVTRCMNDYTIEPDRLQLEVTETVVLDESALVRTGLDALRRAGVKIILDDFGTGYSSLSNLVNLSIDGLKIDRHLTRGVPARKVSAALLTHLVGLTHDLGLSLVIEGVETEQQVAWLSRFGDVTVQGFYFSKPVPAAALPVARAV